MLLTTLAFAQGMANIMENLDYQIVGILVVMMCLGGLAVILTISGSIAASIQNKAKAKAAAASAAPAPVPAAAPAAAGKPGMTPEMLAILSAAVDSAMTELTPEMVARHLRRRGRRPGRHEPPHRGNQAIPGLRLCGRRQGGNLRLPPHPAQSLNHCIIHPYPRPRRESFNLIFHTIHYYEETSHHRRRQGI